MSVYYKQKFVSAEPLFAEVKEELHSYFSSGSLDDVMFPKWTEHALRRFRKSAYKISEVVLEVKDYKAKLPDDFISVREAWMCTTDYSVPIPDPSALYYQTDCRIDRPDMDACDPCFETEGCTTKYLVVHKVTGHTIYGFHRSHLLKPGNHHAASCCGDYCANIGSKALDTFDIQGCDFLTSFHEGKVYLLYYASPETCEEQMVPDNFWVQDYIRKFIIYKCFVRLSNTITDETANQIERKKHEAKMDQAEAFILAETELKKWTVEQKIKSIKDSYNRLNQFRLPGDMSGDYGR